MSAFSKDMIVRNTRTGELGVVKGVWWNEFAGAFIVNVRVNGRAASWNSYSVGKAA